MKIKVFELEFDASNLHEVSFVKEVISGSNLSAETVAIIPEREAKETVLGSAPHVPFKPAPVEEQPAPVEEQPAPVEVVTDKTEEPTAKEMQDLVIGLIRSGELSRDGVENIFQVFAGRGLVNIVPAKFALLKQRLTTYKNG